MPAVCLAVQTSSGNAGIQIGRVARADLQDVRDVQAQQQLHPLIAGQAQITHLPQFLPGTTVTFQRLGEARIAGDRLSGAPQSLADRAVVRGIEGDHLLNVHRLALAHVKGEDLLDVVLHLIEVAFDVRQVLALIDARAGCLSHVQVRLPGLHLQGDHLGAERPRGHRIQVTPLELTVAGHPAVGHPPVQCRDDLHPARPILRCHGPLDTRLVDVSHADEATAAQRCLPAGPVAEAQFAHHHGGVDVQLMPVGQVLDVADAHRLLALDDQLEHEPVRQVDQILVEHGASAQDRRLAVVGSVGVRTRVMHAMRVLPLGGPAGTEVAVAG
jgi:hypothetical protein